MNKIKTSERGWGCHFICADRCRFRRNTLIEYNDIKIVVSTVGLMNKPEGEGFDIIGYNRYYETRAFHSDPTDERYHDIDVERDISFDSPWSISEIDADDKANDMHNAVVFEICDKLKKGMKFLD